MWSHRSISTWTVKCDPIVLFLHGRWNVILCIAWVFWRMKCDSMHNMGIPNDECAPMHSIRIPNDEMWPHGHSHKSVQTKDDITLPPSADLAFCYYLLQIPYVGFSSPGTKVAEEQLGLCLSLTVKALQLYLADEIGGNQSVTWFTSPLLCSPIEQEIPGLAPLWSILVWFVRRTNLFASLCKKNRKGSCC